MVILIGDGARMTAVEFSSKEKCDAANAIIQENKPSFYALKSFCVEK
jgi:hypothetical protein